MSTLHTRVQDYLRIRRALGYKLERAGTWLTQLADWLDENAPDATVTSEAVIAWVRQSTNAGPIQLARRLGVARRFCAWLATLEPATEIPPAGVFPTRRHRPAPYLWSPEDISRLIAGARALARPLQAATLATLFGLLAATGMRIGEAVAIHRADVDLDVGVITIHHAKFDRDRLVPLHSSTVAALRDYAERRDLLCPRPRTDTFFVSTAGTTLDRSGVGKPFRRITTSIRLRTNDTHPRIHDLRHSFAMRALLEWQRNGIPVDERIAVLSTYLGHIAPADTYWYLEASPQLMQLAADRLDAASEATR